MHRTLRSCTLTTRPSKQSKIPRRKEKAGHAQSCWERKNKGKEKQEQLLQTHRPMGAPRAQRTAAGGWRRPARADASPPLGQQSGSICLFSQRSHRSAAQSTAAFAPGAAPGVSPLSGCPAPPRDAPDPSPSDPSRSGRASAAGQRAAARGAPHRGTSPIPLSAHRRVPHPGPPSVPRRGTPPRSGAASSAPAPREPPAPARGSPSPPHGPASSPARRHAGGPGGAAGRRLPASRGTGPRG